MHYLLLTQSELERSEFKALLGLGERLATAQVTALLKRCGGKSRLAGVSVADMRYIRAAALFHMMKIA